MKRLDRRLAPRLLWLFFAGWLLFGYPFLGVFSRPASLWGVPIVFVYLFVAWAVFLASVARTVERPEPDR